MISYTLKYRIIDNRTAFFKELGNLLKEISDRVPLSIEQEAVLQRAHQQIVNYDLKNHPAYSTEQREIADKICALLKIGSKYESDKPQHLTISLTK